MVVAGVILTILGLLIHVWGWSRGTQPRSWTLVNVGGTMAIAGVIILIIVLP